MATLHVGFTGTRDGMTERQKEEVFGWLATKVVKRAHHGDCVGADAQFHAACIEEEIPVEIHPPDDDRLRAFCEGAELVNNPLPFLERNKAIIRELAMDEDNDSVLLVAPSELFEPEPARGQGTWSTVRHTRAVVEAGYEIKILVVWPNGDTSDGLESQAD